MKKMLFIATVLLLVTSLSYAKTSDKNEDVNFQPICFKSLTASLSRGMDKNKVSWILGMPAQTSAANEREVWTYQHGSEKIILTFAFLRDIDTKKMSFALDTWYTQGHCSLNKYEKKK